MENPLEQLRLLVLLVLAAPLVAAAAVAVLGRSGPRVARRTAGLLALAHLGLTALLVLLAADGLRERSDASSRMMSVVDHFQPVAVPGDRGNDSEQNGESHETTWSLLTLGPGSPRLAPPAVQFFVGVDGLNVWLVLLTSLLTVVAVWVSWDAIGERAGAYYAWLFVLETGVLGAFLSFDVVLFYVFFELTLIPVFFLIGQWGVGANRREAARKFFLYTLFGSLFTLAGLVGVVLTNPTPYVRLDADPAGPRVRPAYDGKFKVGDRVLEAQPGPVTFSIPRLMRNVQTWTVLDADRAKRTEAAARDADWRLQTAQRALDTTPNDPAAKKAVAAAATAAAAADEAREAAAADRDHRANLQVWLFVALIAGFAVKTPVVPFHTWLPAAYYEAPMAVTMVLSALLAKLGTFGMLRVVVPLVPDAAFLYGLPVLGLLGAAGIVYAAFCAYAQRDAKLLVAYSSVSHLGLLVLGLFALNREGVSGAVLHMVNHGLSVGALFSLLGFLYDRYRTTDLNQYGGLIGRFPAFAALFFVIALAGIGLPGLNNFVSEMLLIAALFDPVHTQSVGYGLAAVAAFGVFLSAWYMMTMLRRLFFGPTHEPAAADGTPAKDVSPREALAYGVPAVLCIVLGVYPQPVLDTIRGDAEKVVQCVNAARARAGYTRIPPPAAADTPAQPWPADRKPELFKGP